MNGKILQGLNRIELPLHPHLQVAAVGLQYSRALHGVLRAELVDDLAKIKPQACQPSLGNFDEDFL